VLGYLGVGSNVGDRRARLQEAVDRLPEHGVQVLASSSVYDTEPVGLVLDQPQFLNAVLRVGTEHGPPELLDACKAVEREIGRTAGLRRHAPRVIDVDVLLVDGVQFHSERLTLPHPEVSGRRFVLVPLLELDPELTLPGSGVRLAEALASLGPGQGVQRAGPPLELGRRPRPRPYSPPMAEQRLLVVDVGNTQTHFGLFRDGADTVEQHWRFATVRDSTSDELGAVLANLLALRKLRFEDIGASIVSSTVPELSDQWTEMATRYLGHEMLLVGPAIKTGMPIRIDNPYEVGADRLVNAIAAYERVRATCVVVDFGTAITYDAVSPAGEYLGGIITPGAEISIDALYDRAAKLPKVELAEPRTLIGKSTVDAIRSGIVYGFAGQVEGIVRRLRAELGADTTVIATGGLASALVPFIRETIDEVDDLLTLTGLRLIYERNQQD
jgi:type III pantothenate kinase